MPTKKVVQELSRSRATALGKELKALRENRHLSRAELLDRFYTELERAGIDYKVKGDWWLHGIENGEKAKQLPREYIRAFIAALNCTKLEAVRILILADLNTLSNANEKNATYSAGLTLALSEMFTSALKIVEAQVDEETAARLNEREWMVIAKAVFELVIADQAKLHEQA